MSDRRKTYIRARSLTTIPIDVKSIPRYKKNKTEFYNYAVSFDTETTSFTTPDGEPRGTMYIWQMCFGDSDLLVYGRTWSEWVDFLRLVRKTFHLKKDRVLLCFVHNLGFDAQFFRKLFQYTKVFALDRRVPLYMRTNFGIEFRCSYHLSGYKLETLAKNLTKHKITKLVGDLDYKLPRHSGTPLTAQEMDYCMHDVQIINAYISERLEIDGNILNIPLTKTGYVRRNCRKACYGDNHRAPKYFEYRKEMERLTMTPHEYTLVRSAFMGGYVHANAWYVRQVITEVESDDFTSSYPYVLFAYKYPWSKGELCYPDIEEVMKNLHVYGWILEIEMYGVESKVMQDDYLSKSKCIEIKNYTLNNGRVNSADYIHIVVTSVDLDIILQTYRCTGGIKIKCAYKYLLKYLPTDFINEMLDYYKIKTELKNVKGKEQEYLSGKENINAFYGMIVTSPLRPTIKYKNHKWSTEPVDIKKGIEKYNNDKNRFMPFVVGVFVTAYARRNLWSGILACGDDYIYSDTDSIKLINADKHRGYFEWYNNQVLDRLHRACEYHKIPFDRVSPVTIKGVHKTLGLWDCESKTAGKPTYSRFKTLGAKRYMVEDYTTGELSLTVSGLNKEKAIPWLQDTYGDNTKVFDAFTDDEYGVDMLHVPEGYSGRMESTYIDNETEGYITDYLGNTAYYHELSSVALDESTYTLSLSRDYLSYLLGLNSIAGFVNM